MPRLPEACGREPEDAPEHAPQPKEGTEVRTRKTTGDLQEAESSEASPDRQAWKQAGSSTPPATMGTIGTYVTEQGVTTAIAGGPTPGAPAQRKRTILGVPRWEREAPKTSQTVSQDSRIGATKLKTAGQEQPSHTARPATATTTHTHKCRVQTGNSPAPSQGKALGHTQPTRAGPCTKPTHRPPGNRRTVNHTVTTSPVPFHADRKGTLCGKCGYMQGLFQLPQLTKGSTATL